MQRDQLAGAHLLQPHAAHQLAGAHAGEGDAVAVVRVHVRLDLEHQRRQAGLGGLHNARIGRLGARAGAVFHQPIEQVGDADLLDRAAEIHRRQVPGHEALHVELRQGRLHQLQLLAQRHHPFIGLRQRFGDMDLPLAQVVGAHEGRRPAHRPGNRRGIQRQRRGNLVQQRERVLRLAVELVDEGHDRDVAHAADLEQLARSCLDALGRVDHHHRGIHRRERAVGVLGEVLMTRRIEQVEHAIAVLERHHRGHHGDAALALDPHPVRPRAPPLALGAHVAGELDRPARAQQPLGQRGLAGIGVGDDRERPAARDFGNGIGAHGAGRYTPRKRKGRKAAQPCSQAPVIANPRQRSPHRSARHHPKAKRSQRAQRATESTEGRGVSRPKRRTRLKLPCFSVLSVALGVLCDPFA